MTKTYCLSPRRLRGIQPRWMLANSQPISGLPGCAQRRHGRGAKSFVGLMLFALTWPQIGCQRAASLEPSGQDRKTAEKKSLLRVDAVAIPRVQVVPIEHLVFARLQPTQSQVLAFPWTGVVKRLADVGTHLKAGEVVAELDDQELVGRRAQLLETLEQTTRLADRETLQNQLREIEQRLATRTLRAPFDCVVFRTFTRVEEIQPERSRVAEIIADAPPLIAVTIPTDWVSKIAPGTEFRGEFNGETYVCQVTATSQYLAPHGQFETAVELSAAPPIVEWNPTQRMKLEVVQWRSLDGFAIPTSALHQSLLGDWTIHTVAADKDADVVRQESVELLLAEENWSVVAGEIPADRRIIPTGNHRITAQQAVEITDVTEQYPLPAGWNRSP